MRVLGPTNLTRMLILAAGLLLCARPSAGQTAADISDRILSENTKPESEATERTAVLPDPPVRFLVNSASPPQTGDGDLEDGTLQRQLLQIHRVYVDDLTGDSTAAQIRELIIASLHGAGLFVITENEERADAYLRGAAEDLIFTDQFQSGEGTNMRSASTVSTPGATRGQLRNQINVTLGDNESINIHERKHEALATVRLVNLDGDVIWSTTQESEGAKFRGASADVAAKITKQLVQDYRRLSGDPGDRAPSR